jgi:diadenosine tetraphosphate (Ap4A) HIT family hydrolase
MFALDPRLAADAVPVAKLPLCRVLLMRDQRFPWLILVPERENLKELHDLTHADQRQLMNEVARASRVLERLFRPDKINVGALGNVVPQLHVHVVSRKKEDAAWPGPVWGHGERQPYDEAGLLVRLRRLREAFAEAEEQARAEARDRERNRPDRDRRGQRPSGPKPSQRPARPR